MTQRQDFAIPMTPEGAEVLTLCVDRLGRTEAYKLAARMGFSASDTAKAIGVSRQAVDQSAKYHGYRFKLDFQLKGEAVVADLAREAAERGLLKSDISQVTGIGLERIRAVARRHGIAMKREPLPAPRVAQIRELAAKGMTVTEVAKALAISQPCVSRAKKRHGITFARDGRAA
jgi:predicted transcriptional regulator